MPHSLLKSAKQVILLEADALTSLACRLDKNFTKACQLIQDCQGKVVLIGMGKSGHIAGKIAATLASTGTPAFTVHPGEAGHGDLGMIEKNDVVVCISYSGESDEIMLLSPMLVRLNVPIIAMTSNKNSSIGKISHVHLDASVAKEACPHNLAPTASTTVALALGDAIAISLLVAKGFSPEDFARSHPSGALGRKLLTFIKDIMKTGSAIPVVSLDTKLLDALVVMSEKALGFVIVVKNNHLQGVFTDGDLRRVLASHDNIYHLNMHEIMSKNCQSIAADKPAIAAVQILDAFNLGALPVVDKENCVVGAINTHTLMQAKII
jgi:arabinose-5-phosphate isomerase